MVNNGDYNTTYADDGGYTHNILNTNFNAGWVGVLWAGVLRNSGTSVGANGALTYQNNWITHASGVAAISLGSNSVESLTGVASMQTE